MDLSLIASLGSAINSAVDLARSAVAVRDAAVMSVRVAEINEQLLSAQRSLFAHNTDLLALQQQMFQTQQELAVAKEALAKHRQYALFEISPGVHVYRSRAAHTAQCPDMGEAFEVEPTHYVCPVCRGELGLYILLIRRETPIEIHHACPRCKETFVEKEKPVPSIRHDGDWRTS